MASARDPSLGMSFFEHLDELRKRLFWSVVAFFIAFVGCYTVSRPIFVFLARPIQQFLPAGEALAYTRLTEPFMLYFKVAALAALFVSSPFLLLQVWLFVAPGLYRNERRYAIMFVGAATGCFVLGAAFAFGWLFPGVCRFFLSVGEGFRMVVTIDEYFSLLFWTVVGVALTFELPVAIGILARFGLVSGGFLARNFNVAVVGCLIVSAIITPTPDATTMIVVAIPMIALYAVSILVAKLLNPTGDAAPVGGDATPGSAAPKA